MSLRDEIIIGHRFRLMRKIGSGNSGSVYFSIDISNGQEIAMKIANGTHLEKEKQRYSAFIKDYQQQTNGCSPKGFPDMIWTGEHHHHYCIAYEFLGPTLEDLFEYCDRKFSYHTVFFLGEQILDRLQSIHQTGYTHGSIKPMNIVMGQKKYGRTVFLIDFGSMYPTNTPRNHTSTSLWKSINRHKGFDHGMRDDLESWLYLLAYFLHGSLLWEFSTNDILFKKENEAPKWMDELKLGALWLYVRNLKVDTLPDYRYMRKLLFKIRPQSNPVGPQKLDWEVKPYKYLEAKKDE
ncbi:MAG: hypothetical protein EOP45_16700 [Sphingobacteriaceae bacterium]|nr:MAG: hypothetical protein EOP45_16700 [Sphingobacteriaceae bacterium]